MTASSRFDEKSFSEQLSELHKLSNEIEQMFAKLIMLFYESCDEYAARGHKLNVLITGATGAGKSSTINALFDTTVARVGYGVDPETMDIEKYDLKEMVLWDTPGLGDGREADNRHAKNIIHKLHDHALSLLRIHVIRHVCICRYSASKR